MRMLSTIMTAFMLLAPVAFAEFPKEITIGDKTFEVRQPAEMRKLGFECEEAQRRAALHRSNERVSTCTRGAWHEP